MEQPLTAKKSKLNCLSPAAAVVAEIAEEAVAADMVVVGIGTAGMAVGVTAMVGVAVTGMAAAVVDVMTAGMEAVAVAAAEEADVMTMGMTAVTATEATTVGMTKL